jgi:hypothetical protein
MTSDSANSASSPLYKYVSIAGLGSTSMCPPFTSSPTAAGSSLASSPLAVLLPSCCLPGSRKKWRMVLPG